MMGGYGFGIPGLGFLVFWGLIFGLILWALRSKGAGSDPGPSSARRILDERFARGEIDQAEYEERRRLLEYPVADSHDPTAPAGRRRAYRRSAAPRSTLRRLDL